MVVSRVRTIGISLSTPAPKTRNPAAGLGSHECESMAVSLGDGSRGLVLLIPLLQLFLLLFCLLLLHLRPVLLVFLILLLRILLCGVRTGVSQRRRSKRHKQEQEQSDSCKTFHHVTAKLALAVFYSRYPNL